MQPIPPKPPSLSITDDAPVKKDRVFDYLPLRDAWLHTSSSSNYDYFGTPISLTAREAAVKAATFHLNQCYQSAFNQCYQSEFNGEMFIRASSKSSNNLKVDLLANAAEAGRIEIVKRLINAGVDPKNQLVAATLLNTAAAGRTEILRLLFDAGLDPTDAFGFGGPAFMQAVKNGHVDTAELFISRGIDVKGPLGEDALKGAAEEGHLAMVWFLIKQGAPVQGRAGLDALKIARHKGYTDIAQLLESLVQEAKPGWTELDLLRFRRQAIQATKERNIERVANRILLIAPKHRESVKEECMGILESNQEDVLILKLSKLLMAAKRKEQPAQPLVSSKAEVTETWVAHVSEPLLAAPGQEPPVCTYELHVPPMPSAGPRVRPPVPLSVLRRGYNTHKSEHDDSSNLEELTASMTAAELKPLPSASVAGVLDPVS